MFDYRIINDKNEVLGEYSNTEIQFERLSPPQTGFILSDQMLEDIENKKYSTRFYLVSPLMNDNDGEVLDQIYQVLKPLENQKDFNIKIQVKYKDSPKYSTILNAFDLNYIARLSRYDPTGSNAKIELYNQLTFLCN